MNCHTCNAYPCDCERRASWLRAQRRGAPTLALPGFEQPEQLDIFTTDQTAPAGQCSTQAREGKP